MLYLQYTLPEPASLLTVTGILLYSIFCGTARRSRKAISPQMHSVTTACLRRYGRSCHRAPSCLPAQPPTLRPLLETPSTKVVGQEKENNRSGRKSEVFGKRMGRDSMQEAKKEEGSYAGAAPSALALLQAWEGVGLAIHLGSQQGAAHQRLHTKRPMSAEEKVAEAAPRRRARQPMPDRDDGPCDCCALDPGKSSHITSFSAALLSWP